MIEEFLEKIKNDTEEKIENIKDWVISNKEKIIFGAVVILVCLFVLYYMLLVFDNFLKGNGFRWVLSFADLFKLPDARVTQIYVLLVLGGVFYIWLTYRTRYRNRMETVAGVIKIPQRAGSNEHGSAKFSKISEIQKEYDTMKLGEELDWLKEAGIADSRNIKEKANLVREWQRKRNEIISTHRGEEKEKLIQDLKELEQEKNNLIKKWEMEDTEREKKYQEFLSEMPKSTIRGGIILNWEKKAQAENVLVMNKDRHIIILGPTRSGKNRNVIFQSIGTIARAGENGLVADVKGENYLYTGNFLRRLGYYTPALDFREPIKSIKYNFLQPIINALDENDIPEAVNACWDLTSQLVGEPKGERIWTDGEASIIAGSIMAVAYDNQEKDKRRYQNLTNVYHFIHEMAETIDDKGRTKIQAYADCLPDSHPSKAIFGITKVAPKRTAGSFYTAALATLRLFVNPLIYEITRETTLDMDAMFNKKTMLFLILPDEKKTYHPIASLFIAMFYQFSIKKANQNGGRLSIPWWYLLDEFGNFTKIAEINSILTASASRGILLTLVVQSFPQIEERYGKEFASIIKDNCEIWVYLNSNDDSTKKEFSNRLGNYTIYSFSKSVSYDRFERVNSNSSSANLTSRELLKPDELGKIERPYMVVSSGRTKHFVSYSPDLSKWGFNDIYGLGDQAHNEDVILVRNFMRKEGKPTPVKLWGVWKQDFAKLAREKKEQAKQDEYVQSWASAQEILM